MAVFDHQADNGYGMTISAQIYILMFLYEVRHSKICLSFANSACSNLSVTHAIYPEPSLLPLAF